METNLYEAFMAHEDETAAHRVPPEEYAIQKKEERELLNEYVNTALKEVSHNPAAYLHFLEMQTKLNLSATNVLAVMAQMPHATMLKDFDGWKKQNNHLKKDSHHIKIFDAATSFTRDDGSEGHYYPIKRMFDISQLKKPPRFRPINYSDHSLLSAMTGKAAVRTIVVDNEELTAVHYNSSLKRIEVPKGLDNTTLVSGIAKAICEAQLDPKNGTYTSNSYTAFCAASVGYMLCCKYEIPCQNEFADKVEAFMGNEDPENVKDMLSTTVEVYKDISNQIDRGLYKAQQQQMERSNDMAR